MKSILTGKYFIILVFFLALITGLFSYFLIQREKFRVLQNIDMSSKSTVFVKTYPTTTIENLWSAYKNSIQKDGRTIDRSQRFLTTSEGQSYSLLRAVWMDDKDTFDRVLNWTNHNLRKRENDRLFAWKWGQNSEGVWDVLADEGGMNTASDADQDIALALIFAHQRWNQDHYIKQAREILDDIWRTEVIIIYGRPYLTAGNWAINEAYPTLNPSYFSPFAYPIFAQVDPVHDWMELRETSYEVLDEASSKTFGSDWVVYLPPDWVSINPTTAEIYPPTQSDKTLDFSDDAFRAVWRVALDWKWHKNPSAREYLERLSFLKDEWERRGYFFQSYNKKGEPSSPYESKSIYGGILPYFEIMHPELAEQMYFKKVAALYDPDIEDFGEDIGYYAQNWVWFGMAYYEDRLINLYSGSNPL